MGGGLDSLYAHLELGDEHPRSSQVFGSRLDLLRAEPPVGSGGDDDSVLPVRGYGYEGAARQRFGGGFYPARVHPVLTQVSHEILTEAIFAYPPEHRHVGPEACGGGSLVGALTTRMEGKLSVGDGLAGLWTAVYSKHEVLIYGADDENPDHRELSLAHHCNLASIFYRIAA